MIIYVIMALAFITLFSVFYTVFGIVMRKRQIVKIRLENVAQQDSKNTENELNQPIYTRTLKPVLDDISKTILKITPKEIVASFEKKVVMAGNPFKLSVKDWINLQVVFIVCLPLATFGVGYYLELEVKKTTLLIIIEIILGILLPHLILSRKVSERSSKIQNSLPDVLDLLTVSVEAGLGFDGALTKVIDKMPGPLADEFASVLQEIKVGKNKRDALKDMTQRVCVTDLSTFTGSIIQADQLGVSIGNVLRLQSEQMRQKRKQRAQEKAMKAPVKMLIPMVLFIFPTIFSVLIGPVVIKVIHTFIK